MKKIYMGNFTPMEYKLLESYLNSLSFDDGLCIERVKFGRGYFSEEEKGKYRYCTDIILNNVKDIKGYRDFYSEMGWEFVCEINNIQIFRSETEKNLPPIHTDEKIEKETIKKYLKFNTLSYIPIVIIIFLQFKNFKYTYLLENTTFISLLFAIGIVCYFIYENIKYYVDYKKVCYLIDKKENIVREKIERKIFIKKIRGILYLILVCLLLLTVVSEAFSGNGIVIFMILFFLYMFLGGTILAYIKAKDNGKITKKFIISSVVFVVFSMTAIPALVFSGLFFNNLNIDETVMPEGGKYAKCSYIYPDATVKESMYRERSSLFVPKSLDYWEISKDNDVALSVRTEYFNCINNTISKFIFDSYIDEYNELNEDRYFDLKYNIEYVEPSLFGVDEAVVVNDKKAILLKGDEMFIIELEGDITTPENIAVCKRVIQ